MAKSRRNKVSRRAAATSVLGFGISAAIAVVVVGALCGAALFAMQVQQFGQSRDQEVRLRAEALAGRLSDWIAVRRDLLARSAGDPKVADLFGRGDLQGLEGREAELTRRFPDVLRVRLLPLGMSVPDTEDNPQLSYAPLDLLGRAEQAKVSPPAELHRVGAGDEHIALAARVLVEGKPVGLIHVAYPATRLRRALDGVQPELGRIELRQLTGGKPLLLAANGGGEADLDIDDELPVAGSIWMVAHSSAGMPIRWGDYLVLWAIVAVGASLAAVLVLLQFRRVASALRGDQATIVNLVQDVLDGRAHQRYLVRIQDFRDTLQVLAGMGRQSGARQVRERIQAVKDTGPAGGQIAVAEVDAAEMPGQLGAEPPGDGAPEAATAVAVQPAALPSGIFGAYDIQGRAGHDLTLEIVYSIGRAVGSEAYEHGEQSVIVARDGRDSGVELSEALGRGLRESGVDVVDLGVMPTPVLYFGIHYLKARSGVVVTAGHSPPEYNGLKIVLGGSNLAGEGIQALRRRIEEDDFLNGSGELNTRNLRADYIGRIDEDVQLGRPMKVVVDSGNGAAGLVAPDTLRTLGCEVVELYGEVDGSFPNHLPDPSQERNLRDLIAAVAENDADLGLAFDGDGDRLNVVDSSGRVIWPDRLMMLLAADVLSRQPGADIIYDVRCSRRLADEIIRHGGRPMMWKTGHSFIKAKLKETGALLAGEFSGHIFFTERWYGFDDAMYAGARLLEILSADSRSSAEVFAELPDDTSTPELRLDMEHTERQVLMERVLTEAQFPGATLTTIDGLRAEFEEGWGLVRASHSSPALVFRFEADDADAMARIQAQFRELILGLKPDLELPF